MKLSPTIEYDEDEIHAGHVVEYPRVRDVLSGGLLLDLANGTWHMVEGVVTDGAVHMVVRHSKSNASFQLDMRASGHWRIDGQEPELVGSLVPDALARKNIDALIERARVLLAERPFVPQDIVQGLDAKALVAKLFYPRIGKDGAQEVKDSQLYWLLYELDKALAVAAATV